MRKGLEKLVNLFRHSKQTLFYSRFYSSSIEWCKDCNLNII